MNLRRTSLTQAVWIVRSTQPLHGFGNWKPAFSVTEFVTCRVRRFGEQDSVRRAEAP